MTSASVLRHWVFATVLIPCLIAGARLNSTRASAAQSSVDKASRSAADPDIRALVQMFNDGRHSEVEQAATGWLQTDPGNLRAYCFLLLAQAGLGKVSAAKQTYDDMSQLRVDSATAPLVASVRRALDDAIQITLLQREFAEAVRSQGFNGALKVVEGSTAPQAMKYTLFAVAHELAGSRDRARAYVDRLRDLKLSTYRNRLVGRTT